MTNKKSITIRVIVEIIHSKLLDIYRRQVRRKSSLSAGVATLNKGVVYIYMTQENAANKQLQDNSIVSIRMVKKYIIPKASVANFINKGVKK